MKFAAPYQIHLPTGISFNDIDEFNIKFTKDSSFEELRKFIKMYPSQQINIEFAEENYNLENIINVCNDYDNVYVCIHRWELEYLSDYEENNVNYIFDKSMPIYTYSFLEWVFAHTPKGIYIADDLVYNLEEVYTQCKEHGIKLRVILNRIPVTVSVALVCPSVPIYKPQDYNFLSQYYDVGEFDCGEDYDWTKAEVLYRKWFIEHEYGEDLEFMNYDLALPYPTKSIPPELTRLRSVCRHRCTMRATNVCSKCSRLLFMGYTNADNNLVYTNKEYGLPSLENMVDSIIVSEFNNSD